MKQEKDRNLPAFRVLAMLALAALAVLFTHTTARAQSPTPTPLWIPTGTNISPINTGNVGIGTTAPSFKLEVSGSASRNTAGLSGDGDSVGYVGLRFGALTTTNIGNNKTSAFVLSMRKDTWYGGDGSGPSFVIETTTKGGGFAAPFLITPTNDIILNSGRGAGGPAGYVPPYGNVGIGTHTPGFKLDVAGSVNASGGFCIAGVCKTSWPQVSGGWTASGSNVYFNTGSVGFGTTTPAFMLDSMGAIRGIGETNVNITNQSLFTGGGQQHYFDSSPPFAPLGRGASDVANGATTGPGANPGGIFIGGFGGTSAGAAGVYAQGGDTHTESYNRAWGGVGLFAQGGQNGPHTGGPYGWAYSRYAAAAFFNGYVQMGSNDGRASGLAIGFDGFNGYGAKLPPSGGMIVSGTVGVGTSTPAYKLDVQGGQLNASGGLCIAGDCRVSWAQVTGGTAATQWSNGTNGVISYSGGNVGVGTAAPGARLDVGAGAPARGGYTDLVIGAGGNNPQIEFYGATKSSAIAHDEALGGLLFHTNGPNFAVNFFVGNNGNVGVGTTAPAVKLHVAGGERVDGTAGRIYLGTGAVQGARGLEIVEENATTFSIRHHDPMVAWQNIAINPYGGNVGIGTPTPRGKLEVAGGPLFLGDMGNASWGNMIVRGRVISSNNNIHLSPPGGTGVYINSDYREAGGSAGPVTLNVSGNITGAGFCIGTDCKTSWSQVGGGSSQWTPSGSNISYNDGAVGIGTGTAAPAELLEVKGSGEVKARVTGTTSAGIQFRETTGANTWSEWQQFLDRFRLNTNDGTTTHPDVISVLPNGNVGIGKAVPTEVLDVVGNIKATGSVSATYQDVAEWVPSTQRLAAGTVVVLDGARTNHVSASASAYDTKVAGVVSEQPGIILGVGGEGKVKVATTGRVRVRVDASRGAIKVGDLLVTSEVEGVAMKSVEVDLGGVKIHRPGTIIGKALEPLEKGPGEILVLLSLQ
jgi:hypothetical protein